MVFIGKGGYWEGKAGGRLGWFPARAIQEVTDDGDSGVFSESCELELILLHSHSVNLIQFHISNKSSFLVSSIPYQSEDGY